MTREDQGLVTEHLWMALAPRPMVQVICLTIDGHKVICLGPVLHVPGTEATIGEVQEIEFGELIPAHLAARLLDGGMSEAMGLQ